MAGSDEVKLLGWWPSPFVMRPRIAFNLKSIPYDYLDEKFRAKSDLLLKSNPVHKKVPVLLHHGRPVCESLFILQYIDETWTSPPSILPSDPYERAVLRFWAACIDEELLFWIGTIVKARSAEAKVEALDKTKVGLKRIEDLFKDFSKGEKFFGGVRIGYLDIVVGSYLGWVKMAETITKVKLLDKEKMPGLVGWVERFCAHKAVKDVMPETDKLIEFAEKMLSKPRSNPCEIEKD
ncbi:hypothetical protein Sjap_015881 [Stephania japonica]|uniref:glutathione transferase n=1 Tax=Stephania japonica TaxID=461633 RepID=A0AAP0NSY5_9MAGN